MANKEFQVRHGLAVNNNVLVANTITGNVGIGTATPLAKLHVIGDAIFTGNVSFSGAAQIQSNFDSILNLNSSQANSTPALNDAGIYVNRGSLGNASIIWNEAIDRWDIRANSTNLVSVLSTGNFGIGTTAPANKLDVRGTLGVGQSSNTALNIFTITTNISGADNHLTTFAGPIHGTNDVVTFDLSRGGGAYGAFDVKFNGTSRFFMSGGTLNGDGYINLPTNTNFVFKNNNTERMRFDANGNLGIGTTTPLSKLSVYGTGSSGMGLFISYGHPAGWGLSGAGEGGLGFITSTSNTFRFHTSGYNYPITLDGSTVILQGSGSTGNVGIGTSSPSVKLHVIGDSIFSGNVTIVGSSQTIRSNNLVIGDSLIYLAANNYSGTDVVDIGFIANYANSTGANVHTGLYRHNATKQYYLFQGYDIEPQANNVIVPYDSNMVNAVLNADLATSNLTLGGTNAISWISSAFSKANNALANTSGISFNGSLNFPSGKVGISTSSIPAANLEVNATAIAMPNSVATILSRGYDVNFAIMSSTGHAVNDPGALVGRFGLRYLTNGDDSASFNFYRGGGSLDGSIGINTNGAERMRITNAGNIGIGTTSPSANLHVIGTANVSSTIYTRDIEAPFYSLYNEGAGAYVGIKGNYLRFGGVSEFMRIANTSGYVGIGTSAPAYRLDVTPTSNEVGLHLAPTTGYDTGFYITSHANNDTVIGSGAAYVSAQFVAKASSAEIIDLYNGGYYFYGDTGLTPGSVYSPTMRMVLDSSGRLGIGTTSPSARLHVNNGNFLLNKQYVGGESQAALTVLHSNVAHQGISYDVALLQSDDAPGLRIVETNTVGNFNRTAELTLCAGDGYANNFAPASVIGSNAALIFATGREVGTPAYNSIGERVRITSGGDVMINQTSSAGTGKLGVAGRIAIDVNGSDSFSGQLYLTSLNGRPSNIQAAGPSSNGIAFWTYTGSWSERVRITGDGNVGIGVTNPSHRLMVQSSSGGTTSRFININTGNFLDFYESNTGTRQGYVGTTDGSNFVINNDKNGAMLFNTNNDVMLFNTNNTERMRITGAGNVGIGVTSVTAKFVSSGTARIGTLTTDYAGDVQLSADYVRIWNPSNAPAGQIRFGINQETTIRGQALVGLMFDTDGSERMRIANTGNIGIGTTSPSYRLDVNAAVANGVRFDGARPITFNSNGTGDIRIKAAAGGWSIGYLFSGSAGTDIGGFGAWGSNDSLGYHWIGSAYNTPTAVFTPGGNVAIGQTSAPERLTVFRDTDNSAAIGRAHIGYVGYPDIAGFSHVDMNSPGNYALLQGSDGKTFLNSASGQAIYFRQNNTDKMILDYLGNLGIGTNSPTSRLHIVKDFAATSPENSNKRPMRKRWVHTTQQGANGYTYTVCTISRDPLNWDEYSPVEILARNTYFQGGSYSRWIFTHGYGVNPSLVCVETGGISGNIPNLYLGSEVTVNSNLKYIPIYCDVPYYREFNFEINHNYTEVSSITSLSQIKFDNLYTANNSAANYSGDITLVPGGGNVGIGTSSPVGKLSVAGNILAPTFNSNTSYTIGIQDAQINSFVNSKRGSLIIQSSSATSGAQAMGGGDLTLKAGNSYSSQFDTEGDVNIISGYNTLNTNLTRGKIRFITNNTERMRIDANGNFGIGTSSPQAKLDVRGVIQGASYTIPDTGVSYQWVKLGTFTAAQAGYTAHIRAYIHFGYNATNDQDFYVDIFFKTSNSSSVDPNGFGGNSWYYGTGFRLHPIGPKWVSNAAGGSATSYDLYLYLPSYALNSHYVVEIPDGATWTHTGTIGQSDPGLSSNTVCVSSAGYNILYGNVGIGTVAPGSALTVATGDIMTTVDAAAKIGWNRSGKYFNWIECDGVGGNNYMRFATGNAEALRITSAGNVGIGTTAPSAKLQISNAGSFTAIRATNTTDSVQFDAIAGSTAVAIGAATSHPLILNTGNTERMRIDTNGNIGIGTTSITQDISGSERVLQVANTNAASLYLHSTNGNKWQISSITGGSLSFYNNAVQRMTIDSSGNVAIGQSSTTYKLQVNGSFAATTKSFVIDHPTKPGMKLRHGSLEGPENGVYVRGKTKEKVIELPEYWRGLVDSSTITVQLTAIGRSQNLYVVDVSDNRVHIDSENYTDVDCYYYIQAERKDVEKLVVEY